MDNSITHADDTQLTWHVFASVFDTPAGQSVGVYIVRTLGTGVTPATPDSLTLRYVDDGGNIIRTVTLNTTANSQTDTFFLTSDGTSGGTTRCDTIELKLQATRAGVGSYDVETDGSPNTAPTGFDPHLDRGFVRGNTTLAEDVSNIALGGGEIEPAIYKESLFWRAISGAASYVARALAVVSSAGSLSGNTNSTTSATRDITFGNVVDDRFAAGVTTVNWAATVPNSTLGAVPAWGFTQTTPDTSGNNRTGYLSGTVRPVVVTTPLAGMDFDGVDRKGNTQLVHCGVTGLGWSTADGSGKVKAKIRRGRTGIAEIFCGKWVGEGTAAGDNYVLYTQADNLLYLTVLDGAGAGVSAIGTTSLLANTDYDIEGEWTGSVLRVKVNGVQEGTTPAVTTLQAPDAVTPFTIGAECYSPFGSVTSDPFDGIITNVEMWRGGVLQGQWALTSATTGIADDSINVNPDVTFGPLSLGQPVYNRGETAMLSFPVLDARGGNVTASLSFQIKDSGATVKKAFTDVGASYGDAGVANYAITDSDKAENSLAGDQWTINGNTAGARFTNAPNVYAVSRKWQVDYVYTDKAHSPASDLKTVFNRGQPVFFKAAVRNARGELLANPTINFNTRPDASETYDDINDTEALAAGILTGAGAGYVVDTDEPIGSKALVIASQAASGANQPRAGTAGSGNFAEQLAALTVSATYTVLSRTQGSNTAAGQQGAARTAGAEDVAFTTGNDAIYVFGFAFDAHGDPVQGASVILEQLDSNNAVRQSDNSLTTDAGGCTAALGALGAAFDTRTPTGPGWKQRARVANHNGNSGTTAGLADENIVMLSAYTANKNIIPSFGGVSGVPNTLGHMAASDGNHFKGGDLGLMGLAMLVDGVRIVPEGIPEIMFAKFDIATAKAVILQADGTWQAATLPNGDINPAYYIDPAGRPRFFTMKFSIESGLEWLAYFGTAAQISLASGYPEGSAGNFGHIMDTATWPAGRIYMACKVVYGAQVFYDDEWSDHIQSSRQHPYTTGALPEVNVQFDPGAGHSHDGVNSRESEALFRPIPGTIA